MLLLVADLRGDEAEDAGPFDGYDLPLTLHCAPGAWRRLYTHYGFELASFMSHDIEH